MHRFMALGGAILSAFSVTIALAASTWPMDGYNAQHTNFNPGEQAIGPSNVARLHPVWSRNVSAMERAIVAGNRIYAVHVRNGHGEVVVLDAPTGAPIRTFTSGSHGLNTQRYDDPQAVAYAGGRLVIAAGRDVLAINPQTGSRFWKVPGGADQVEIAGRTVFTGKGCQNPCGTTASYAIDLYSGKVIWTHRGNFGQVPVLIAGRLFQTWGEMVGVTHVYDPQSGTLLATLPLNASWTGDATHAYAETTGRILTGTPHSWLEYVAPTGKPVWRTDLGKTFGSRPVFAYNTLYASSYRFNPGLVAVNARTGKVLWGADLGQNLWMVAANHLLYVIQTQTGQVTILNAATGNVLRRFKVTPYVNEGWPNLVIANGTLYVLRGQGIVAYRV